MESDYRRLQRVLNRITSHRCWTVDPTNSFFVRCPLILNVYPRTPPMFTRGPSPERSPQRRLVKPFGVEDRSWLDPPRFVGVLFHPSVWFERGAPTLADPLSSRQRQYGRARPQSRINRRHRTQFRPAPPSRCRIGVNTSNICPTEWSRCSRASISGRCRMTFSWTLAPLSFIPCRPNRRLRLICAR